MQIYLRGPATPSAPPLLRFVYADPTNLLGNYGLREVSIGSGTTVSLTVELQGGTEGYLPDRQPVLGPSRTTPGLLHGFGFAGAGFQIGPAAGEVLAELACQGHSPTPIDAFDIGRFAAPARPR